MASVGSCPADAAVAFDSKLVIGVSLSVIADIVVAIALSVTKVSHNRNWDPVEKRPRQPYVKLPLWWLGIILTASGEVGNLIAYGFAPAAIVAPVGSVGVLMNGFLATCCLKEPLRKRDVVGMISIVAGVVLLVLGVPQTTVTLTDDVITHEVLPNVRCWGYLSALFICVVLLLIFRKRYAHRHPLYYLMLCALIASVTVIAARAFSSMITLAFEGWLPPTVNLTSADILTSAGIEFGSGYPQAPPSAPPSAPPVEPYSVIRVLKAPVFYGSLLLTILTAIFSVKYLNAAMMLFGNSVVVPLYYCTFTLSSVIGAAVVYNEFACMTPKTGAMFGAGCACAIGGVYLVGGGRKSKLEEEIANGDNLAHPGQDIAEVLHLPNVLGLGDSTFGSPLASPKGSAYSTGHFGHNHPQRAAPDQRNGGGAEGMHTLPIEPHSTSPASARVAPRPVYEVGNELSHTLSPTSMSGALGYVKGKFRRGPSGSCIGASGSRAGTEMEELVRRHSPSWAKEEDACVREAASDAVSRLSRIISPLAVRPPQLDTDGEVPPSGARIDDGADDVYQATAEILLEEEQRRCAAYASMGDTEAGREVYATAVRQLISRLTRRLGHGRRRNRAAAGDDDLESDEVPTEVATATQSYMEALRAHYASISNAITSRNVRTPGTGGREYAGSYAQCINSNNTSPFIEGSHSSDANSKLRNRSRTNVRSSPGIDGSEVGPPTADVSAPHSVPNQAALARARRAASSGLSLGLVGSGESTWNCQSRLTQGSNAGLASPAGSPRLHPMEHDPPSRASLSAISLCEPLYDESAPQVNRDSSHDSDIL